MRSQIIITLWGETGLVRETIQACVCFFASLFLCFRFPFIFFPCKLIWKVNYPCCGNLKRHTLRIWVIFYVQKSLEVSIIENMYRKLNVLREESANKYIHWKQYRKMLMAPEPKNTIISSNAQIAIFITSLILVHEVYILKNIPYKKCALVS